MKIASNALAAALAAALTLPAANGTEATKERLRQWLWPRPAVAVPHHVPFPTPEPELPPPFHIPPPVVAPDPPAPVVEKPHPKPKRVKVTPKEPERKKVVQRTLPSCAVIRREYERMTYGQRIAAYARATPAEVAHGKRCLGM